MTKKFKVGFIGLGLMGNPMAKNIYKAGFTLSVFNRNSKRLADFKKLKGVNILPSPAELSKNVDFVITCVTGPEDVKEVMLGKDGVLHGFHPGLCAIDMSTIGPTAAVEVAKALKKAGVDFLDAPVTGGTTGAEKGTLTIFTGGDEEVYKRAKPVLEAMGTNLQYMGRQGNGQAMKLINNLIVGITTEALAEGFLLADSLGLKRERVAQALEGVFGMSPGMKAKMPNMVANKFPVSFSVANIRKDLMLAVLENKKGKTKTLPVGEMVERLYRRGMDLGYSEQDLSAIVKILSDKR